MNSFDEMLDTHSSEVKAIPPVPNGLYTLQVIKGAINKADAARGGEWDTVDFVCKIVEPAESVDAEELADYTSARDGVSVRGVEVRLSFMFSTKEEAKDGNAKTMIRLNTFLMDHLKIEQDTLRNMIPAAVNFPFMGLMQARADKNNPALLYNNIARTAAVE